MINIKKQAEQQRNPPLRSKRARRKQVEKIADKLHSWFGKRVFGGIGEGTKTYCSVCEERIYSSTSEIIGGKIIFYCDKKACRDEVTKLKEDLKNGKTS